MRFFIGFIATVSLFLAVPVHAHRVNVFAWVQGNEVHVESEFSRGNPVRGGVVEVVRDGSEETVATGRTDDAGALVFTLPESVRQHPVDLEVVVVAGQGHRNSWTVRAQDYAAVADASNTAEATADDGALPAQAHETYETPLGNNAADETVALDAVESRLEDVVDRKLDEKLAPLVRAVNHLQEDAGPSMADVFGGIGYLIGLAGLAAYFKSRRQS